MMDNAVHNRNGYIVIKEKVAPVCKVLVCGDNNGAILIQSIYQRFRLQKAKEGNEFNAMKQLIDLALIEIIRDLDFKPRRFNQCPKCKSYFYQPTEKERIYCTTRCGDAVRLQKFRKEKKKLQKQLSDESDKK